MQKYVGPLYRQVEPTMSTLTRGGDEGPPYVVEKYIHNQQIVGVIVVIII
jgi:hypothetical protein